MKKLDKKLIIDNWFRKVFQTFFEKDWKAWNVISMERSLGKDALVILPITKNWEILYIREFKFWPDEYQISLITWWAKIGQLVKDAVKDELLEETGYRPWKIIHLWHCNHNNYIVWRIHLFLCLDCEKVWDNGWHDLEETEVFKISIKEFENMIYEDKIFCPYSMSVFLRAKKFTKDFTCFDFNLWKFFEYIDLKELTK